MRRDSEAMTDWHKLASQVGQIDGVRDVVATTYNGALLTGDNGPAYAVLRGIDSRSEHSKLELSRSLIEGSIDPLFGNQDLPADQLTSRRSESALEPDLESFKKAPSDATLQQAVIGSELASRTGLRVGDVAQIISGDAQLTPLGLAPRYRRLRIAGIFRLGLYEYDASWIYVSLPVAASIAGAPQGSASVISVDVFDIYAVNRIGSSIRNLAGNDFVTIDWQEANRPLFAALSLERRMGLIIIGLIIFIATLNIAATLVLVVVERRTDIAILTAMGARARNIMLIFVIEGACIGLIGTITGVLIGIVACLAGDRYKLVSLPADVYSLNNIPFHARVQDVAIAAGVAFLLSLLATIYPARAAARVRVADALREN
jgi:lipoprotein-releasing system permease protein